jgi:hypothetical protein
MKEGISELFMITQSKRQFSIPSMLPPDCIQADSSSVSVRITPPAPAKSSMVAVYVVPFGTIEDLSMYTTDE